MCRFNKLWPYRRWRQNDACRHNRTYYVHRLVRRSFQRQNDYGLWPVGQEAIQDAHDATGMTRSRVEPDYESGNYIVKNDHSDRTSEFTDRDAAIEYAEQQGFVALRCTERLGRRIEDIGIPDDWTTDDNGHADLSNATP